MRGWFLGSTAVSVFLVASSAVFGQGLSIGGPAEGDGSLFFFDDGSSAGQSLIWDDSEQRFRFSEQLQIDAASLRLGILGGILNWNAADDRFETSETFVFEKAIQAGYSTSFSAVLYNSMGAGTPDSEDMTNDGDLYVQNDVEVGLSLYLNRQLYMEASPAGVADGNQEIFFFDQNSREGEMLRWNDDEDYFEFTNDLTINSDLNVLGFYHLRANNGVVTWLTDADDNSPVGRFEWSSDSEDDSDILMELDQNDGGDLAIGGQLTQNASFNLAVGFPTREDLQPGDVVRIAAGSGEEVERHEGAYDPLVVGVVSTNPGVALGSGAFGVDDLREIWGEQRAEAFEAQASGLKEEVLEAEPELRAQRDQLLETTAAALSSRDAEALRKLERTLGRKTMRRFFAENFAMVAVAGRAPVTVDASFGSIARGDYLTASPLPGVAMKATKAGPVIGFALEELESGQGQVVAMIDRGWFGGSALVTVAAVEVAEVDAQGATDATGPETLSSLPQAEDLTKVEALPATEGLPQAEPASLERPRGPQRMAWGGAAYQPVSEAVEPGDLLVADRSFAGFLKPSSLASDPAVVGFASEVTGNMPLDLPDRLAEFAPELVKALSAAREESDLAETARIEWELERVVESLFTPVATSGIATAKVDATYGSVEVGDLLVASPTRGYAMKATDTIPGTVVAKALEGMAAGTGRIQVLVMHR